MATWPANAETDWNTKMLAYLAIGHDTDGTHNQEDWTPSIYTGGESITFPNGLIIKMGFTTIGATTGTVTFGVAFPNGVVSVSTSLKNAATTTSTILITDLTTADIDWRIDSASRDGFYWIVIGR